MSDDSGNGGSARSPRVRTSHATWSGGATDEQTGPAGEPDDEPAVKQPAGRLLGLGAPSGPPCQLRTSAVVAIIVVSMAMLAAASVIGWSVSYKAGVRSVESIGKSMEQLYPERAIAEMRVRIEPLRIHMQHGLALLKNAGIDSATKEADHFLREYGLPFVIDYFADDTQSVYGLYHQLPQGDLQVRFDVIVSTKTADVEQQSTDWQIYNLQTDDSTGCVLMVPFNMTTRRFLDNMSSTAHEMDFLHHPCTGSVIPPLVSGWQNVLETNDMQEGDFCITPVYVLALSHPARLKIGGIAPLARKSEVSTESVHGVEHLGAYMVSIDLQPLSRHLSQLDLKGGKIFIVERATGSILASNNASMPMVTADNQTIQSHDVEDRDIRELSWILAPTRSWENVVDLGHNSAVISNRPVFVFVDTFRKYCVDWLVVVEMPRESILEGIISHRTTTLVASISAPLAMFIFLIVMLAFGIFARRILKRSKWRRRTGPPGTGEKATLAITDIQGSTTLWDTYPEQLARDIAVHHQCLRAALREFDGYEIATEGDSFKCAFHSPEDAICWSTQVQLNLLCAPWTEELEDGGHDVLSHDPTWSDLAAPSIPDYCCDLVMNMAKDPTQLFTTEHNANREAKQGQRPKQALYSTEAAAATKYSRLQVALNPDSAVYHVESEEPLPVFRGLRVRIAIHTDVVTHVDIHDNTKRVTYGGQVAEVAKAISNAPSGGQIIMSGESLAEIESMHDLMVKISKQCESWGSSLDGKASMSCALSVMHLGSHVIADSTKPDDRANGALQDTEVTIPISGGATDERLERAHELVMVVPWVLRARVLFYPPQPMETQVTPAWHGAPSAENVTILFTFIDSLTTLKKWQDCINSMSVLNEAIGQLSLVVRSLLVEHSGYEVEGEEGNFVCAFGDASRALRFAAELQDALLYINWSDALLCTPWANEEISMNGNILFRGLRMAVGMCTGEAKRMQPSVRTGRMEYYGPLMNHAARLAVAAHGGQVLAHESTRKAFLSSGQDNDPLFPIELLVSHGCHKLKGVSKEVEIFQLSSQKCPERRFPPIKTQTTKKANSMQIRSVSQKEQANIKSLEAYARSHSFEEMRGSRAEELGGISMQ